MRSIKRLLLLGFSLVVVLAIVVFMLENQQSVSLVFFGWTAPSLSVSLPLIAAFLSGMVIGPILGLLFRFQRKRIHNRDRTANSL